MVFGKFEVILSMTSLEKRALLLDNRAKAVAKNKSKSVSSGHMLASEHVYQTQELRATKVNYLLYINEWIRF